MVYDKLPSAQDSSASPTDEDEDHDTEFGDECGDDSSFVSPGQSQIMVRRNRRGKRRVLAESFCASPDAADSEMPATSPEDKPKNTKKLLPSTSRKPIIDDAIFKCPGNTAPLNVNRRVEGIGKVNTGYSRENENMDDIFAVLNDCDDESFMMEINALENTTLAKMDSKSNPTGSKLKAGNNINIEFHKSKCDPNRTEDPKSNVGRSSCGRSVGEYSIISRQERSRIDNLDHVGNKCETILQTSNSFTRTSVKENLTSTSAGSENNSPTIKLPVNKTSYIGATVSKGGVNSKDNCVRKEQTIAKAKFQPQNTRNSMLQSEPRTVSPLFPPLSNINSSNDSLSHTCGSLQRTAGRVFDRSNCDTSKAVSEHTVNATKSSPASTVCLFLIGFFKLDYEPKVGVGREPLV